MKPFDSDTEHFFLFADKKMEGRPGSLTASRYRRGFSKKSRSSISIRKRKAMEIQADKSSDRDYSPIMQGFEPSMPWDVAGWIASLHSSLMLDGILRECGHILAKQLHLRRLSLAQRRGNASIVTIYSMDLEAPSMMSGPKIEALEPSRLKDCMSWRNGCVSINLLSSPPDKTSSTCRSRPRKPTRVRWFWDWIRLRR
jgi:hypothetical protein